MSSHAATALRTTANSANTQRGAPTTIHTKTGMPTAAVSARWTSVAERPGARGVVTASTAATSHPTEPARAALEVGERAIEIERPEIRPQRQRHPELGVGDLPQEEVRHAHLPAGADQEVGIGDAVGVEGAADVVLRDVA